MHYYVITLLSQIYVNGPILKAVQESHMYPDSKYFVDMALKHDPVTTLRNFDALGDSVKDIAVLRQFVEGHFHPAGTELVEWFPEDWQPFPSTFLRIGDYQLRRWALHLHRIWRDLCRKIRRDVDAHQELYSLLYVPHPFIIPGGRFREFYYWDSFWILKGLLFSEMYDTAKGVILNFIRMVDDHGFVPNGGRVYYLSRSQPPLLIPMVYEYYMGTGDLEFVMQVLPSLEKEYQFWMKHRLSEWVDGDSGESRFSYFQYKTTMKMPRPESYREDLELVVNCTSEKERERIWSDIASAAETGWDFSTRWFAQDGDDKHDLKSIRTWKIVPVDLNAFMCANSRILSSLFEIKGDYSKSLRYHHHYEAAKREMREVHWNETDGVWYDYDLETKRHSNTYYVSNAIPLYAKCYDDDTKPHRVYQYLEKEGVLNFTKGLPTSLAMNSAQQWDKENAWPPMIHMVIDGFRTTGQKELMKVAARMATGWLKVTYQSFMRTHAMFEKYNVSGHSDETAAGGGGEYEVQTGFGWTNGVILDLLDKYGGDMQASSAAATVVYEMNSLVALFAVIGVCQAASLYGLKPFGYDKYEPSYYGPAYSGPAHYGAQYGPAHYGPSHYGNYEFTPKIYGYGKTPSSYYGPAYSPYSPSHYNNYQHYYYGPAHYGPAHYSPAHYGTAHYSPASYGPAHYGLAHYGPAPISHGYGLPYYGL